LNLSVNTVVGSNFGDFVRFPQRRALFCLEIFMKKCLSVAGSDCSGGAGIQADLKTFSACGVYGMSVITSAVAENTARVISVFNLPAAEVANQLEAVFEDIAVDGVKLGMLPTAEIIGAAADCLLRYRPQNIVLDPVLSATSGGSLSAENALAEMKRKLFPIVDLLTPNIPEAQKISGVEISSLADFDRAAEIIMGMGVKNLLIKGGHLSGDCLDVLYLQTGEKILLNAERVNSPNTHGTGCTLSSAITAQLAKGENMAQAVKSAKAYITQAIEKSFTVGKGHSPVNHFYEFYSMKGIE
jgi:hydroxymethylpyrimidine/phosphomethylpyrimidine kinase